ncbi:MAG: spore cortex biosynthesis protein YabQ [Peptococcaceae bacterium]|nr:spore cortex biosynthesis protein YabQ [Peptococcaceae bacterium]
MSEFAVLLIIVFSGVLVGLCFDFYRIARWRIGLNKIFTFITDLIFSCVALFLIYFFAQKANFLELRFYLFGGCFIGLMIYLRFFSPGSKQLFNFLFDVIAGFKNLIVKLILTLFCGGQAVLTIMMSIPYGILRWGSLLIFRMGEALGKESVTKVKGRISNIPRRK